MEDDKQTREQRIQGDTSLAKQAAHDFGGSPSQPMVDAETQSADVTAKLTGLPVVTAPGTVEGQLLIENRSLVDMEIVSSCLHVSPAQAGATVSFPFTAGKMRPAIRLDRNDLAVIGPVAVTFASPGIYRVGATVRLRVKDAEAGSLLEHVEAEPVPVAITHR